MAKFDSSAPKTAKAKAKPPASAAVRRLRLHKLWEESVDDVVAASRDSSDATYAVYLANQPLPRTEFEKLFAAGTLLFAVPAELSDASNSALHVFVTDLIDQADAPVNPIAVDPRAQEEAQKLRNSPRVLSDEERERRLELINCDDFADDGLR